MVKFLCNQIDYEFPKGEMMSAITTSTKISVPLTEVEMNKTHSCILYSIQYIQGELKFPMDSYRRDNLTNELADLMKLEISFRQLWKNSITADEQ